MSRFAERYDALVQSPSLAPLYEGSGRFNVGWWRDGAATVAEAAERLTARVASRLPPRGRRLEVACGARAADAGADRELGVLCDLSLARLRRAAHAAPGRAVVADAIRLPFRRAAFDQLLSIEAAFHFDSRAGFFAEASRLLAPGGTLALSDFLVRDAESLGGWLVPAANRDVDIDGYRRLLAGAGFAAIEIEDATDACWRGFCAALRRRSAAAEVARIEAAVAAYVIAVARRAD